jgi:hypothetical protein
MRKAGFKPLLCKKCNVYRYNPLFEDDPDIAMLKETRDKLAKLKVDEEARKKEERGFFKDRALSIERKEEELRVEQIQEMIANHALGKKHKVKLGVDGVPLPPVSPPNAPAGGVPGRPRKKKGAVTPTSAARSPEASSPELSPRGGPPQPAAPPPPAPAGGKPPARPNRPTC